MSHHDRRFLGGCCTNARRGPSPWRLWSCPGVSRSIELTRPLSEFDAVWILRSQAFGGDDAAGSRLQRVCRVFLESDILASLIVPAGRVQDLALLRNAIEGCRRMRESGRGSIKQGAGTRLGIDAAARPPTSAAHKALEDFAALGPAGRRCRLVGKKSRWRVLRHGWLQWVQWSEST